MMAGENTRYVVNQIVNDATYGLVTIQEAFPATLNSPEQFGFVQNSTGLQFRAVITQVGESAPAIEVEAAVAAADAASTPAGT